MTSRPGKAKFIHLLRNNGLLIIVSVVRRFHLYLWNNCCSWNHHLYHSFQQTSQVNTCINLLLGYHLTLHYGNRRDEFYHSNLTKTHGPCHFKIKRSLTLNEV
jgi:hypothetical protein